MPIEIHPAISSFPAAFILLLAVCELAKVWYRRPLPTEPVAIAVLVAIVVAFLTGPEDAVSVLTTPPEGVVGWHHTMGKAALIAAVPMVVLKFISSRALHGKRGFAAAYVGFLLIVAGLTVYTGYLGGQLVFAHGYGVRVPAGTATSAGSHQ